MTLLQAMSLANWANDHPPASQGVASDARHTTGETCRGLAVTPHRIGPCSLSRVSDFPASCGLQEIAAGLAAASLVTAPRAPIQRGQAIPPATEERHDSDP